MANLPCEQCICIVHILIGTVRGLWAASYRGRPHPCRRPIVVHNVLSRAGCCTATPVTIVDMRGLLDATAWKQDGIFTRAQAIAGGLTSREFATMTGPAGPWVRVRYGVYAERRRWQGLDDPARAHLRALGALLMCADDAVLSHSSAAAPNGLPLVDVTDSLTHLTRDGQHQSSRTQAGVKHHVAALGPEQVLTGEWFAFTDPLRTVLDLSREFGYRTGLVAADAALRLGADSEQLLARADVLSTEPHGPAFTAVAKAANGLAESPSRRSAVRSSRAWTSPISSCSTASTSTTAPLPWATCTRRSSTTSSSATVGSSIKISTTTQVGWFSARKFSGRRSCEPTRFVDKAPDAVALSGRTPFLTTSSAPASDFGARSSNSTQDVSSARGDCRRRTPSSPDRAIERRSEHSRCTVNTANLPCSQAICIVHMANAGEGRRDGYLGVMAARWPKATSRSSA